MTTEEFVDAVNALDNRDEIDAEVAPDGTVSLAKCGYSAVATLEVFAIKWLDLPLTLEFLKSMSRI